MPAIELTDRELYLLAKLARTAGVLPLARKLEANTFQARGLTDEPPDALVHVHRADK